jgi:hypothetical protein
LKAWDMKEFIKKDLEMFLMTYSGFPKNVWTMWGLKITILQFKRQNFAKT